jgi:hypothetical protein
MKWPRWLRFALKAAPVVIDVVTQPDKREILRARILEAIAKLERRDDEPAKRKLAELRRSLQKMELEDALTELNATAVKVTPAPAFLHIKES